MTAQSIGIILLAAGESKRMAGEPKQLLKFRGESLIRRAALSALNCSAALTVAVLGANPESLEKEILDLRLQIAVNENWRAGMASSIQTGLAALLKKNQNLAAVVILLCDQPLISPEIINRLIEAFEKTQKPIITSGYENIAGVPALFAREMFDELMSLQGDEGARKIIKKRAASVEIISVPEAAFDVDTPEDVERLKSYL